MSPAGLGPCIGSADARIWLQGDQTPRCPDCREPMTFYAQLDSVGDTIDLADCGMVCVFVCLNHFTTSSVLQAG